MGLLDKARQALFGEAPAAPRDTQPAAPPQAARQAGVAPASVLDELVALVASLSERELRAEEIDPSADILEYGYVDSLSAATLITEVEQRYGLALTESDLVGQLHSLQAIAARVSDGADR